MQQQSSRWPWGVALALVVVAAGWWLFRGDLTEKATHSPEFSARLPAAATPPAPAAAVAAPPQIQHPVHVPEAADAAIPALADSDDTVWQALGALAGDDAVLGVLVRDHLVSRLVTMIDNLPQPSIPRSALALRPLPGELQVVPAGDATVIADGNAQRYAPWVKAFTHADPQALADAYRRFYPLFQQAYVELGYPKRYFNDRLIEVIDHLLRAPEPTAPLAVALDARGKYRFVDPALESLSVGQKALLRLGPAQEAEVKAQLRALRTALAQG